jgi:hypothetical protein
MLRLIFKHCQKYENTKYLSFFGKIISYNLFKNFFCDIYYSLIKSIHMLP